MLLKQTAEQIPEETAPKVKGTFYKMYRKKLKKNKLVDIDALFSSFDTPMEDLSVKYEVERDDDIWFNKAKFDREVEKFAIELCHRYKELKHYPKNKSSALIDAILITWLKKQASESSEKFGLVTLDRSLPGSTSGSAQQPFILTLDALLQWASPVAVHFEDEDSFASIFSEAVKYQLLPQETFFEMKDFCIFSEIHMSSKELPATDVENCIKYIKHNFSSLDTRKAEDREKLSYEISKFFADPARKHNKELERLKTELLSREEDIKSFSKRLDVEQTCIKNLKEDIRELDKNKKEEHLRLTGVNRLIIILFALFVYEAVVVVLAIKLGSGKNWFQKALNSWQFLGFGPLLFIFVSWFVLGKDRLHALGWPLNKLLRK